MSLGNRAQWLSENYTGGPPYSRSGASDSQVGWANVSRSVLLGWADGYGQQLYQQYTLRNQATAEFPKPAGITHLWVYNYSADLDWPGNTVTDVTEATNIFTWLSSLDAATPGPGGASPNPATAYGIDGATLTLAYSDSFANIYELTSFPPGSAVVIDNTLPVTRRETHVFRLGLNTGPTYGTESYWPNSPAGEQVCYYSISTVRPEVQFLATAVSGTNRVMVGSWNGAFWEEYGVPETNEWRSSIYAHSPHQKVVSVASGGTNRVMTSPDGISWTPFVASSAQGWQSIAYGAGIFVAVAISIGGTTRVMRSTDGETWADVETPGITGDWSAVTYGAGLFVAVGIGTNKVMTSEDGLTWTARTPAQTNMWRSIVYSEEQSLFVAVATSGTSRVMTSPDGITWTARTAAEANEWRSVTYGQGKFVAVAWSGTNRFMRSTDGITWVSSPTGWPDAEDYEWRSVTHANGVFIAISGTGTTRVAQSYDGILWNPISAPDGTWNHVTPFLPQFGIPPTASFTATPDTGFAPLSVDFDASGSDDSDGTILSYAWDFGDGEVGTGVNPTHVYSTEGTFTVTLTVTDDDGLVGIATSTVDVDPVIDFQLTWWEPGSKVYERGVDRGVLYLKDGRVVPWSGLTAVDESAGRSTDSVYFDGVKLSESLNIEGFSAKVSAITYPEQLEETYGNLKVRNGVYLGEQAQKSFGFCYRSKLGTELDEDAGYKLHIIYNITALPDDVSYITISDEPNLTEFSWEFKTTPEILEGYRPSAYLVLNSIDTKPDILAAVESILYGTEGNSPRLPPLSELLAIINGFSNFIDIVDNGDGTWTASTLADGYINDLGGGVYEIQEANIQYTSTESYLISPTSDPPPALGG